MTRLPRVFALLTSVTLLVAPAPTPSRADTPVTPAEQAADEAPSAQQALGACAYAYLHLKSYHCKISESETSALTGHSTTTAEIWFEHPRKLRINCSNSYSKGQPSAYLSDGSVSQALSFGKWSQVKDFGHANLVPIAGEWAIRLLLNSEDNNVAALMFHNHPSIASGTVNGHPSWLVTTSNAAHILNRYNAAAKRLEHSVGSVSAREVLSIDQRTFLIDRYETYVVLNGKPDDTVQTVTLSQPDVPIAATVFTRR